MARTPMTVRQLPNPYGTAAPVTDLAALDTFDNANGMTLVIDGQTTILFLNSTGGGLTFTIGSANDPYTRTRDVTAHNIPTLALCVTATFPQVGWNSGGTNLMNVDASGALKYFAYQRYPGT